MSMLSYTNHVDKDIFLVSFPIINNKFTYSKQIFHSALMIVSVNPNHGDSEALYDIGLILKTMWVTARCCEANLIIRDDMNGAADGELR